MDDDFFTFESSWEEFSESNTEPEKFHITNVWHEMGHFIGHNIARRCGFDFGEITAVDFGEAPRVFVKSIYSPNGEVGECHDYYGLPNLCFQDPADISRITAAVKDKEKTLAYILYLLCGGYFNIYIITKQPTEEDFENCYLDSIPDTKWNNFIARAGNDWTKTRRLSQIDRWDYADLKKFRSEVYYLFYTYNVFAICSTTVNNIDSKFNGLKMNAQEVQLISAEIEECLNQVDALFWSELNKIISFYALKF